MNAYQKAKVERSLILLRYLLNLAEELKKHCQKHQKEVHTVCTAQLIEKLVKGRLLYVEKQERRNHDTDYFIAPFEEILTELITDLEQELRMMGGKEL